MGEAADIHLPVSQSLMQLQNAADRIFDAIVSRVGSHRTQLKGLSDRITSVQAKVGAMAGTRRATTVFSSAKCPQAEPSAVDFVPLFEDAGMATVALDTGQSQSQEEGTLELFRFFSETSHEVWQKGHGKKAAVGRVPARVKSVADVLLFNSSELPYHNFRVVDNLAGPDPTVDRDEEVRPLNLPPAPPSLLGGDAAPRAGVEEFGFRPLLRPVPSFSLPSVLPDLPMVAEISWSGVTSSADRPPSIAPSAVHGGSVYNVSPRFDSRAGSARFDPSSLLPRSDSASESARTVPRRSDSGWSDADSIRSERTAPPRTLPPLHVTAAPEGRGFHSKAAASGSGKSSGSGCSSSSSSSSSNRPSASLPLQSAARANVQPPVPPPPPPPLLSGPAKSSQGPGTSAAKQSLPHIDSQRAALMASIRSSGLDLLRKTGRKENQRPVPEASLPPTVRSALDVPASLGSPEVKQPLNVMAEMAKSLTLRRLSMRGGASSQAQTPTRTDVRSSDDEGQREQREGIAESSRPALPSLHTDADEANEEQSDDDDDDDDDEWD